MYNSSVRLLSSRVIMVATVTIHIKSINLYQSIGDTDSDVGSFIIFEEFRFGDKIRIDRSVFVYLNYKYGNIYKIEAVLSEVDSL